MARSESYNLKRRLARRVRRGVIFLNAMHPGWEDRIDLENLSMRYPVDIGYGKCICAQLGIANHPMVSPEHPRHENTLAYDEGLGFSCQHQHHVLDVLWKAEIERIRSDKAAKQKAEAEAAAAKLENEKNEVFGKVVDGIIGQKCKPALHGGGCKYRTPDGLKCAAGQLIPDCDYKQAWEGTSVHTPADNPVSVYFCNKYPRSVISLISECQGAHDGKLRDNNVQVVSWANRMLEIYDNNKINSPIHKAKLETVVALMS